MKLFEIDVNNYAYTVKILDSTHLQYRIEEFKSHWSIATHIAQLSYDY